MVISIIKTIFIPCIKTNLLFLIQNGFISFMPILKLNIKSIK